MQKIIINACFGGYGWSNKASYDYLVRKGVTEMRFVKSVGICEYVDIPKDVCLYDEDSYNNKEILIRAKDSIEQYDRTKRDPNEWCQFYNMMINREDSIAIALLEEKGSKYCSGDNAELVIREYNPEDWIANIHEYDGLENLVLKPLVRKSKIRDCKSMEEVIKYLETFDLFRYDKEK